jgi:hypothetical protein
MPEWLDTRTFIVIAHLIGVALGAGGAYMSDAIFLYSMKDHVLSKTEVGFMSLGSKVVWVGVGLLVLSGVGLFALSPAEYLASPKFLAKMNIVLVVIINGLVFHFLHFPYIRKHSGQYLHRGHSFHANSTTLFISGAISGVSWTSALILGAFRSIPASYSTIMLVYLGVVALAICAALAMRTWHRGLATRNP